MKVYIVDSFTTEHFCGNQAGVVLLEDGEIFPEADFMCRLADELRYSETAFVKCLGEGCYQLRYFTPVQEVPLCGHATVAAFTVLYQEGYTGPGVCRAETLAGSLEIAVTDQGIWMEMAAPRAIKTFNSEETAPLYAALGLDKSARPEHLWPKIISTGLSDIMLPVSSRTFLDGAVLNAPEVSALSEAYDVTGIHLFCLDEASDITARCRNFAPLCGIDEESATGTSNGALTWYLKLCDAVHAKAVNTFIQGEAMGRPSVIQTIYDTLEGKPRIRVGGNAVVVFRGELV